MNALRLSAWIEPCVTCVTPLISICETPRGRASSAYKIEDARLLKPEHHQAIESFILECHGKGKYMFATGNVYEGEWQLGKCERRDPAVLTVHGHCGSRRHGPYQQPSLRDGLDRR